MYRIFNIVIWRGYECMVTRTYTNSKIVISPMGNGNCPAKYYNVHESEVKLK